jgi:hypothetical protein
MYFTTALSALALASTALAWGGVNMETTNSGPTGAAGQTFEMTIDDGATWQDDARNMPLGADSTVGFRLTGDNSTSVVHKV